MARLNTKVKLFLEDNSKIYNNELDNFQLRDDGSGEYIDVWTVSGLAKPNDSKIAEYETAGNAEEAAQAVSKNRRKEYPSIAEQLDDLYHNGIDGWKATIKTTKDKYPKE